MSRKGWITLATVVLVVGGAAFGTAAVAAELRMETSPVRTLPGGAVTGVMAPPAETPITGEAPVTDPPATSPGDGAGVAVAPVPPAVAPSGDDDDDDDAYDDGDDGDDDD